MELREILAVRRMTRSFAADPLDTALVDRLLAASLRAPTAGNTGGTAWVVLAGPAQTPRYWSATTTAEWRAGSRRWPGLSRAPVVALSLAHPAAYVDRYSEADKRASGLGRPEAGGAGRGGWPVPYWFGDAAFATMALLLGAADGGLGACFLGNFRGEAALLSTLGVPGGWRAFGAVLLGRPDGGDHRPASLDRPRAPLTERIHHGRWQVPDPPVSPAVRGSAPPGRPAR